MPSFQIKPGRLLKLQESCRIESDQAGRILLCRREGDTFHDLLYVDLQPGVAWEWQPDACGSYLVEGTFGEVRLQRSLSVVDANWAVCQITVGAFTAEDYAEIIHPAGVSADYYVMPRSEVPFSLRDERWARYESTYGDVVHPHLMADGLKFVDARFAQADPNWDTLPLEEIVFRLRALQEWWLKHGYTPLDHLATYTPSNLFVRACEEVGIRILHSLVPEQNWSDGQWSINHWGMPTCPFWISREDFRKPGPRHPRSVLGMTMNHYHVVLPHLTHWGDFVLSPSHFDRWIRAADSGEEPVRFRQFLEDIVGGWKSFGSAPLFFSAGFEFGRTFGTRKMTQFNRMGLQSLIELAGREKLVFATSRDVLAYYERHCPTFPESAFRQRDSWAGVTVNGKPAHIGDSVVIERNEYKAAFLEGEALPYFYYDYTIPWHYETRDENAPDDFAAACRETVAVRRESKERIVIEAARALPRPTPVVIWDGFPKVAPFPLLQLPLMEDARGVAVLELPRGWSGTCSLDLGSLESRPSFVKKNEWCIQTFGSGEKKHSYLVLDLPLTGEVNLPIELRKKARVDGPQGPLGMIEPGETSLPFGPLKMWYRFWQCGTDDIVPPLALKYGESLVLPADAPTQVAHHESALVEAAAARIGGKDKIQLQVLCGANLPLGTRSRARAFDRIEGTRSGIQAGEFGDGVISFGPGKSFWYHPRSLHFKIRFASRPTENVAVLLNSFSPSNAAMSYRVVAGGSKRRNWNLPASPFDDAAWFALTLAPDDFNEKGVADVRIETDQEQILTDWWKENGFIAALHALWIHR